MSSLRKTLEETENRLQEALSNEGLARRDCQRQLEEAKAVTTCSYIYFSLSPYGTLFLKVAMSAVGMPVFFTRLPVVMHVTGQYSTVSAQTWWL